jgi:hypothetical protein
LFTTELFERAFLKVSEESRVESTAIVGALRIHKRLEFDSFRVRLQIGDEFLLFLSERRAGDARATAKRFFIAQSSFESSADKFQSKARSSGQSFFWSFFLIFLVLRQSLDFRRTSARTLLLERPNSSHAVWAVFWQKTPQNVQNAILGPPFRIINIRDVNLNFTPNIM